MFKFLISLTLVAAQSLTWATGSLYVCVSADGSACIDRGPQFCECCHADEHASHGAGHSMASCCPTDDAASWQSSGCDCQHRLMAESQQVTSSRSSITIGMPQNVVAHIVVEFDLSPLRVRGAIDSTAAISGRLSSLNTVVLRC